MSDERPYDHWTSFLRQHAGARPRTVLPYVAFPPHVAREGEQCVEEQLRYVEAATVLTDRWGAVSVYDPQVGDWFDEQ